jgi:hypothetical protein
VAPILGPAGSDHLMLSIGFTVRGMMVAGSTGVAMSACLRPLAKSRSARSPFLEGQLNGWLVQSK